MAAFYWMIVIFVNFIVSGSSISNRKLIVICLDGLAQNPLHFTEDLTPNILEISRNGVVATAMTNQFPPTSAVNHFSLATGLTPQHHGVIGNEFYDTKARKYVNYSSELYHFNKKAVPIWTLNELQHGISGVMWEAAEYPFQNRKITFNHHLKRNDEDFKKYVKLGMDWILEGANLVMINLQKLPTYDHGRDEEYKRADRFVGALRFALIQKRLHQKADVIILSDYGKMTVPSGNAINLENFMKQVNQNKCNFYGESPFMQVVCKCKNTEQNCHHLDQLGVSNKKFRAYTNQQLSKKWQLPNSRVGPCTVLAEPGYAFTDIDNIDQNSAFDATPRIRTFNKEHSLRPIFIANGPSFKSRVRVNERFSNVDLYHLFCRILGLKIMHPVDGFDREDVWKKMLKLDNATDELCLD